MTCLYQLIKFYPTFSHFFILSLLSIFHSSICFLYTLQIFISFWFFDILLSTLFLSGYLNKSSFYPVGWGCRIHRLYPYRGVRPSNECPGYDTKQFDSEASVNLELWGMQSIPSLPSLLGPLWSGEVAPDSVLSMGRINLKCVLMLNRIAWNRIDLTSKLRTYAKLNCLKLNWWFV